MWAERPLRRSGQDGFAVDGRRCRAGVGVLAMFVYGTLKTGGLYWDRYCRGRVTRTFPARFRGVIYNFPQLGYPGVVESESEDSSVSCEMVSGEVHLFPRHLAGEILRSIDILEDFQRERPDHCNEYQRVWRCVDVMVAGHWRWMKGWAYVMRQATVEELSGVRLAPECHGAWPDGASLKMPLSVKATHAACPR